MSNSSQEREQDINYSVPDSFLDSLWEFTGNGEKNSGGYMLAYVGSDGSPVIRFRSGTQTIEMGLRKVVSTFLDTMDEQETTEYVE